MTDRKKPGVAFWAGVVMVVGLLYVASFGPACWISSRVQPSGDFVSAVYRPLLLAEMHGPRWCSVTLVNYLNFGTDASSIEISPAPASIKFNHVLDGR